MAAGIRVTSTKMPASSSRPGEPRLSFASTCSGLAPSSARRARWVRRRFRTHPADDGGVHQPLGMIRPIRTDSRTTNDRGANSASTGRNSSIRSGESMNSRTRGSPVVESGNRLIRTLLDQLKPSIPRQRVALLQSASSTSRIRRWPLPSSASAHYLASAWNPRSKRGAHLQFRMGPCCDGARRWSSPEPPRG
jgi:hypothetical protein